MIYGIGTDILRIERIEQLYDKYGQALAERLLSRIELLEWRSVGNKANFLAKRFAAKEAFAKAVHTGLRSPVTLHHISIAHDKLGRPEFVVEPPLQEWLCQQGIGRVHLSLSDDNGAVVAFVVAEKE
ncbi:holo-ACP synthase [Eikenella corrodens]|uniref:Holo-[acyl-carrier-protein] synthase n=1 Tax=Eikenella corrodens TaxID=539 RepID=A0A1A9RBH4_EIKCO|nr:holo-ACP synthase [Eikenella corrodens]OAM16056.1 holo-ACP synthase [Eikenella corrodens]OAM24801.1 holo-ACP synthase [Eikenella corrodens]